MKRKRTKKKDTREATSISTRDTLETKSEPTYEALKSQQPFYSVVIISEPEHFLICDINVM